MLNSIDHVVYLCRDIAETAEALRGLFGATSPMEPDWLTVDDDGIWTAEFRFPGGAIELVPQIPSAPAPASCQRWRRAALGSRALCSARRTLRARTGS